MFPVHEILMMNSTIAGIIQKGRISQVESNINTAGKGSQLLEKATNLLVRRGDLPKQTAETFLNQYRGMKT